MKRIISLVLAVLMTLTSLFLIIGSAYEVNQNISLGDLNDNGEIDSMDYILLKRAYFGTYKLDVSQVDAADINGNGNIDALDYILLKRAYFGTYEIQDIPDSSDTSDGDLTNEDISNDNTSNDNTSNDNTSNDDTSNDDTSNDDTSNDDKDEEATFDEADVVISKRKNYTTSKEADSNYPDIYKSELTNGTYPDIYSYSNSALSGYATRTLTVTMNLEREYSGIHTFYATYYLDNTAGVSSSITSTVSVSSDGVAWSNLGALTQQGESKIGTANTAELKLNKPLSARYVRFIFTGDSAWIFLDELEVIAFTKVEKSIDYGKEVEKTYENLGTISPVMNGESVDTSLPKICISEAASYTADKSPVPKYADKNNMLTDGVFGTLYENGCWVGYQGGEDITITIDLGKTVKDISSIEVVCLAKEESGIYLPTAIDFKTVDEHGDKTHIGRLYGILESTDGRKNFVFSTEKKYSARYIEITLYTIESAVHFVGEILVYSHRQDVNNGELYPEVVIEEGEFQWENPSDEYRNLISGKTCQISLDGAVAKKQYENNTDISSPILTDGIFSQSYNIHNGEFFKFCQGDKRSVIFDLEKISSVEKFTIGFCHIENWAVYSPSAVRVVVSEDGIDWRRIGEIEIKETSVSGIRRGELVLDKGIKARYVALVVYTVSWTGIDEIEIFGRQNTENAESPDKYEVVYAGESVDKRKEPSEDLLGGTKHLCLLYHSESTNGYTVSDLIPYVSYVDKEGAIKDTMFDSFLFLHDTGSMPSGGTPFENSVKSDWDWCIDDMFRDGYNLYALEEAAGKVKTALNLGDDYKYKVTASLYYPKSTMVNFGDVDGDGVSEDFSVYEDRMKAYRWYVDEIEKRFADADFKNIELVGYYWWDESINTGEPNIRKMLNEISDYLHAKDRDFFWIPYHCASGFSDWEGYGFDIACMQPNYVFKAETPYANLVNNEKLTKMYGMGVEIELFGSSLSDKLYFKKYMEYLTLGAEKGYMTDTVNMYYQETIAFKKAAYSDGIMARTVYETTYHYIKGDLKNIPDSLKDMKFNAEKDKIFIGQIPLDSEKLYEFKVSSLPEHGTVIFDDNGKFYYFAEKGYVGEVKFSFIYNEYLSWSNPCEITINVE